jgi:hypothetical protein
MPKSTITDDDAGNIVGQSPNVNHKTGIFPTIMATVVSTAVATTAPLAVSSEISMRKEDDRLVVAASCFSDKSLHDPALPEWCEATPKSEQRDLIGLIETATVAYLLLGPPWVKEI